MRILVTGGAGFIGSNTLDVLRSHYHDVLAIDNFSTGKSENVRNFCDDGGRVEIADITKKMDVAKIFNSFKPEAVLHLAAQPAITTSYDDPVFDVTTNVIGTINVLEMAKKYSVRRFVYASTSAVYSENIKRAYTELDDCQPSSPYGISKLSAEHYVRLFSNNYAILRYGNVFGPRQHPIGNNQVIARALRHFLHGDEFYVTGSGKQKRDFVFVGDVAIANMFALQSGKVGTFNISYGKSHSVMEMLHVIEEIFGVHGYPWEHTKEPDMRGDVAINAKLAERLLEWKAIVPVKDGLRATVDWWNNDKSAH